MLEMNVPTTFTPTVKQCYYNVRALTECGLTALNLLKTNLNLRLALHAVNIWLTNEKLPFVMSWSEFCSKTISPAFTAQSGIWCVVHPHNICLTVHYNGLDRKQYVCKQGDGRSQMQISLVDRLATFVFIDAQQNSHVVLRRVYLACLQWLSWVLWVPSGKDANPTLHQCSYRCHCMYSCHVFALINRPWEKTFDASSWQLCEVNLMLEPAIITGDSYISGSSVGPNWRCWDAYTVIL